MLNHVSRDPFFAPLATLSAFDDARRRMDRLFGAPELAPFFAPPRARLGLELQVAPEPQARARLTAEERPDAWLLTADVPGLTESDLTLTVDNDLLTVKAARTVEAPEGFTAARRERRALTLEQTVRLPEGVRKVHVRARHGPDHLAC